MIRGSNGKPTINQDGGVGVVQRNNLKSKPEKPGGNSKAGPSSILAKFSNVARAARNGIRPCKGIHLNQKPLTGYPEGVMPLLYDFPTLTELKKQYPNLENVKRSLLVKDNSVGTLRKALPRGCYRQLTQRYKPSDILFGLRVLSGAEKGKNQCSMLLDGGVILKYGANKSASEATVRPPDKAIQNALVSSVKLAREIVDSGVATLNLFVDGDTNAKEITLLQSVLGYHFGLDGDLRQHSSEIDFIRQGLTEIANGLSGNLVLAEYHGGKNVYGEVPYYYKDVYTEKTTLHRSDSNFPQRKKHDLTLPSSLSKESELNFIYRPDGTASHSRAGSIHIDFMSYMKEFDRYPAFCAYIIIHEAAHRYLGLADYAYIESDSYRILPDLLKRYNPDCYAAFAFSLHFRKLIKSHDSIRACDGA